MIILLLFNMLCFPFHALIHNLWCFMPVKDGDTSSGTGSPNESKEEKHYKQEGCRNKKQLPQGTLSVIH